MTIKFILLKEVLKGECMTLKISAGAAIGMTGILPENPWVVKENVRKHGAWSLGHGVKAFNSKLSAPCPRLFYTVKCLL
jgi:hypothetical protein